MENKRHFFRVTNYETPVTVEWDGSETNGVMYDISGNGISFYATEKWSVGQTLRVSFLIEDQSYAMDVQLVRIQDGTMGRLHYAGTFIGQSNKEQSELSARLLRLEAKRRKQ